MPKYLIRASYNTEGVKGLLRDGGSVRKRAAEELLKSVGGKMEAFYFAVGDDDVYVVCEAPDNAAVAAAGVSVCATGLVTTKTTVLLTPEETDEATRKSTFYTPPGK